MLHPDTELRFINEEKKYGVVATKFIRRGTITWVQDDLDQIITPAMEQSMSTVIRSVLNTYAFTNSNGDSVLCWDHGKHVNHSFNPNCFSTAYDFEIAIRDIHPGEELTDDYGYLNVREPFRPIDEGYKRKVVYPDDILTYYKEWDQIIRDVAPETLDAEQPLTDFIPIKTWRKFKKAALNGHDLKSIRECYYSRK